MHLAITIPVADALVNAHLVDLNAQRRRTGDGSGKGLSTAHTTKAGGKQKTSVERTAKMLSRTFGERLVCTLHDALRADVDPRTGGHLTVHHQPHGIESTELVPRGPFRHEVGVGNDHPWGTGVGLDHAHRFATLNE